MAASRLEYNNMQDPHFSLLYLSLGNLYTIEEDNFRHINLLQYLNLLITETTILKIDLP